MKKFMFENFTESKKMVHCKITLGNNNRPFYFAGEVLKGINIRLFNNDKQIDNRFYL